MARSATAIVKPELLIWAREYSRINLELASKKVSIKSEKLQKWEQGQEKPTVKQLKKLAKLYNQSFATFYLPEPPKLKPRKIDDFRKFPIDDLFGLPYSLSKEINMAYDKREIAEELYNELAEPYKSIQIKASPNSNPIDISIKIRKLLGISLEQQQSWSSSRLAFNNWREAIEKLGILVFQSSSAPLEMMRGFSISEQKFPVIVVNRKDVYVARIFTLFHEFAHILLHNSGICDIHNKFNDEYSRNIEVFCNEFAGSFLVPHLNLLNEISVRSKNIYSTWSDTEIKHLSNKYNVSREVILRRLLNYKKITENFYNQKRKEFSKEFIKPSKKKGFVPPALNSVSLSGKQYTGLIFKAYKNSIITTNNVSEYLGVKTKHFDKIKNLIGIS